MTLPVATPLRAYLADFHQPTSTPTPERLLAAIARNAGVLPDPAPGGDHFVLVALPPHLLAALSAYAAPTAPEALPLLEMMGRA